MGSREAGEEGDGSKSGYWCVVQTRSRHEKRVSRELAAKDIPHYLPLLTRRSRWTDRFVVVSEPLFPNYVFVHMEDQFYVPILETRGVAGFVGSDHGPWEIASAEVESIRVAVNSQLVVDPYPYLQVGREVCITRGALKGCHGILLEKARRHYLVLSVKLLHRSVIVEVEGRDVGAV